MGTARTIWHLLVALTRCDVALQLHICVQQLQPPQTSIAAPQLPPAGAQVHFLQVPHSGCLLQALSHLGSQGTGVVGFGALPMPSWLHLLALRLLSYLMAHPIVDTCHRQAIHKFLLLLSREITNAFCTLSIRGATPSALCNKLLDRLGRQKYMINDGVQLSEVFKQETCIEKYALSVVQTA